MKAGGVAVLDPAAWFAVMTVKAALQWSRFYGIEPWGNREAGLRTGLLAYATGEIDVEKTAVTDFVVSAPTKREAKEREKWEQDADEFRRWWRTGRK